MSLKKLSFLDKSTESYLQEFDEFVKNKRRAISNKKAAEGMWHTPAHFCELKDVLISGITETVNKIVNLLRSGLEAHGLAHKIKNKIAIAKIDHYVNFLNIRSTEIINQENQTLPKLTENQFQQLVSDLNTSLDSLRIKVHTEIALYLASNKLKHRKDFWLFKLFGYLASFSFGIFSKICADKSNLIILYMKKCFVVLTIGICKVM